MPKQQCQSNEGSRFINSSIKTQGCGHCSTKNIQINTSNHSIGTDSPHRCEARIIQTHSLGGAHASLPPYGISIGSVIFCRVRDFHQCEQHTWTHRQTVLCTTIHYSYPFKINVGKTQYSTIKEEFNTSSE